ncbi:MBL fold metallo-hydrolase [Altererythrobacter endophyticus]|uniref:MBL fold metallo-hydrolase n=2 Tax=Altericroceibacterium endophyticum TaxID=1808508 RepID=A0A6I4T895_9SPHN|nr:MBL fold metallo-hydrolase [Altericroceibacterium endophyticum]
MLQLGLVAGVAAYAPAPLFAQSTAADASGAKLVLLGTKGGPRVGGTRSNPANALVVDGSIYVIDTGMGVSAQFVKAGLDFRKLKAIFISHMHSDHELEFGNFLYNNWVTNSLTNPIHAYGPKGMDEMVRDYWALNHLDIDTRIADEGRVDPRELVHGHDLQFVPQQVMQDDKVRVSALPTPHKPLHNFAYRFDTPYGSVVYSGDTSYYEPLAEFAKGADVLVHEALYVPGVDALTKRARGGEAFRNHIINAHTTTDEVGKIAQLAGVKKLVMSHFVPGDMEWITDDMWREGAARHYSGEIIVGRDLQEIPVS